MYGNIKKIFTFIKFTRGKCLYRRYHFRFPYFNITELERTLTGGKNAFLFEGSSFFKKGSKVRFEAIDVEGNPLYIEIDKKREIEHLEKVTLL